MTAPDPADDRVVPADRVITADRLVAERGVLAPAWVRVRGDRVVAIGQGRPPRSAREEPLPPGSTITPGLVDMHVHGAGGGDMTAADGPSLHQAARELARHGVTACVASLVTAPVDVLERALDLVATASTTTPPGSAHIVGAHLEGPFLSSHHRGAHRADELRTPSRDVTARLLDAGRGHVRMLTLAPELPGADELLEELRDRGVVAAMGHTAATHDETRRAIKLGIRVGTHLFNGMRQPHQREPGPALTLLDAPEVVVELIVDGQHVHPATARVVARAAGDGRLALISDGVAATAAPDGRYRLGPVDIISHDGRVETADGTSLGGGGCTLDHALRRAVEELGMPETAAVGAVTSVPARALGVDHLVGELGARRRADLAVFDPHWRLRAVLVGGSWVDPDPSGAPEPARAGGPAPRPGSGAA